MRAVWYLVLNFTSFRCLRARQPSRVVHLPKGDSEHFQWTIAEELLGRKNSLSPVGVTLANTFKPVVIASPHSPHPVFVSSRVNEAKYQAECSRKWRRRLKRRIHHLALILAVKSLRWFSKQKLARISRLTGLATFLWTTTCYCWWVTLFT